MFYVDRKDGEHLQAALKVHYPMTIDWTGDKYIGITLDWDYKKRELRTSMSGYVEKALKQFKHILSSNKQQDSPPPFVPPKFGSRKPQMTHRDASPPLSAKEKLNLQQIIGKFLYYTRATDETMGHSLNHLSNRSKGSEKNINCTTPLS